jgi:4-amino-4-deoxy-L-arabinose transferase-like glycosyltransferase
MLNKMLSAKKLILIGILTIATVIRFWALGSSPGGSLVDEPAFGYNAYSILKTGKDEHNKFLPLTFQSYGDQKMPAYVYASVPSIAVFGLNNFAIRLPAAIAGIGIVLTIYLLFKELEFGETASLLAAFITAVSQWTVILSRFSREANLGLLFFCIGLVYLGRYIKKNRQPDIYFFVIMMGLTWYTYVAYRLVTILFVPLILIWLVIKKNFPIKNALVTTLIGIVTIIPILSQGFESIATARLSQTLSDQGPLMEITEDRTFCSEYTSKNLCYLLWNKPTVYTKLMVNRFLDTFSTAYLFNAGDKEYPIFNVHKVGLFPLIFAPFFLIGIGMLILKKDKWLILIIAGSISAIIPAVLAGTPQKIRLAPLFPFFLLIIISGIAHLNLFKKKLLIITLVTVVSLETLSFLVQFLTIHIHKESILFNSHIPPLILFLEKERNENTKIIFKPFFSEPISYYSFYAKLDPSKYQTTVQRTEKDSGGFRHAYMFENIEVVDIPIDRASCYINDKTTRVLFVTQENKGDQGRIYAGFTDNKVHNLVNVYEIKDKNCTEKRDKEV